MKINWRASKKWGLLFGMMMIFLGSTQYWTGWHNVDVAWNMDRINKCTDLYLEESDLLGNVGYKASDVYLVGTQKMLIGFAYCMIGALSFAYYLGNIRIKGES